MSPRSFLHTLCRPSVSRPWADVLLSVALHLVDDICMCCFQTFLFITTKKVVGCSVAVQIDQVCWFHFCLRVQIRRNLTSCLSLACTCRLHYINSSWS